ncbi:MAG: hypothetical protein V4683_02800 [Bacteroidota bacterium]
MENQSLPLEKELEPIFTEKLPAFPENIKDLLVQVIPWLALLGAIFGALSFITLVGAGSFLSFINIGTGAYGGSLWAMWLGIISLGAITFFCAISFKPLKNMEKKGWNYMYYLSLISFVLNLLSGAIIGAIVGAFIGFWISFQVKARYVN